MANPDLALILKLRQDDFSIIIQQTQSCEQTYKCLKKVKIAYVYCILMRKVDFVGNLNPIRPELSD